MRGRRLQAGQTAGFIQMNGKAITVKHDVTAGVTNAVTESVTATPAVAVDQRVTAGVTEAVTDTVTRVVAVKLRRTPATFVTLFGCQPVVAITGGVSGHSSDAKGLAWLRSQPRNGERERRPLAVGGWNRVRAGPSAPGSAEPVSFRRAGKRPL